MDVTETARQSGDTPRFQIENGQGNLRLVMHGQALLEGDAHDGKHLLRFIAGSGVEAAFPLTGSFEPALEFWGTGPLRIGTLALDLATVHATPGSLQIAASVPWAGSASVVTFEARTDPGRWRGALEVREVLPCLMTTRDAMHISVDLEINPGSTTYSAFVVIEGRHIHAPTRPASDRDAFLRIRESILAAVRKSLNEELETNEQRYLAALNDGGQEQFSERQSSDSPLVSRPAGVESHPAKAGYLPAQAAQPRGDAEVRGYLPLRSGTPDQAGGPSSNAGYLPAMHVRAVGYLPPISRGLGYLPPRVPATPVPASRHNGVERLPDPASLQGEQSKLAEYERIAYAVLRCKDLLQALDAIAEVSE